MWFWLLSKTLYCNSSTHLKHFFVNWKKKKKLFSFDGDWTVSSTFGCDFFLSRKWRQSHKFRFGQPLQTTSLKDFDWTREPCLSQKERKPFVKTIFFTFPNQKQKNQINRPNSLVANRLHNILIKCFFWRMFSWTLKNRLSTKEICLFINSKHKISSFR